MTDSISLKHSVYSVLSFIGGLASSSIAFIALVFSVVATKNGNEALLTFAGLSLMLSGALAFAALVLGIIALTRTGKKGFCITGVVLGSLVCLFVFACLILGLSSN